MTPCAARLSRRPSPPAVQRDCGRRFLVHHDRPDTTGGELELVGEGPMRVPPGGREIVLVAHPGRDGVEPADDEFQPATPPIYGELARHQREEGWHLREKVTNYQLWAAYFIVQSGLKIAELALWVVKLPKKTLGTHRSGNNGQGLLNEITLSTDHVMKHPLWDVLGTLLHELIHAWQATHEKTRSKRRGEHNAEFIAKARECGLIVEKDGTQDYLPDSLFVELLRRKGVELPEFHGKPVLPQREEKPGKSEHVRYECSCRPLQAANCAAKYGFEATCKKYCKDFVAVERRKKKSPKLGEACELVPVRVA